MTTYYRCDGEVSLISGGLSCSTNFVLVDEPVFTLITKEQGEELFLAFAALVVTIAVFRALGRIG